MAESYDKECVIKVFTLSTCAISPHRDHIISVSLMWKSTGMCVNGHRDQEDIHPLSCRLQAVVQEKQKEPLPFLVVLAVDLCWYSVAELYVSGAEEPLPCSDRPLQRVFCLPAWSAALYGRHRVWNRFYWMPSHEGICWNLILSVASSPVHRGVSCPRCLMCLCFKIILSLRHQLIYFNSTSNLCLISFHIQVSHLALMNCNCF